MWVYVTMRDRFEVARPRGAPMGIWRGAAQRLMLRKRRWGSEALRIKSKSNCHDLPSCPFIHLLPNQKKNKISQTNMVLSRFIVNKQSRRSKTKVDQVS